LLTRNGHDWTGRFPTIVEAAAGLRARSCLIDGEVVCCDENGLAVFALLRYRQRPTEIFLYAFDLLELDGQDLRREPLEIRKATLASLLRRCGPGLRLVRAARARRRRRLPCRGCGSFEQLEHGGDVVYRHASRLGCGGIVSKRLGSLYVSGRTRHWLKFKNPAAPAVKREAEEDWGKEKWR
jgi:bifunctional non-homologous end joining protein LigD